MKVTIQQQYEIDLNKPIDISMPLAATPENPVAWYQGAPRFEPVVMGDFIGSVRSGKSSTNFYDLHINPHAHGTHTECLGHITAEHYSINDYLKTFHFFCTLISVTPDLIDEDLVITREQIAAAVNNNWQEALVVRTLPNDDSKLQRKYSNTNPPYLYADAVALLVENGVRHLLLDLPSVDREQDGGALRGHKTFWQVTDVQQVNADARFDATITELVFVPDTVADGMYFLNLQICSLENDASPSKPVLYELVAL